MKQLAKRRRSTKELASKETRPDAWERFERAVDIAVTTKPMHRESPKSKTRAKAR